MVEMIKTSGSSIALQMSLNGIFAALILNFLKIFSIPVSFESKINHILDNIYKNKRSDGHLKLNL